MSNTGLAVLDSIFTGDGFEIRRSGFVLVKKDASNEEIERVLHGLRSLKEDAGKLDKVLSVAIGSLVLEHAARQKCSIAESVDSLGVCPDYDVARKTVMKWARIVSIIPEDILSLPNVHMSHLDAATSYAGPKTPQGYSAFAKHRDAMLREISESPKDKGKRYVEDYMRTLKVKYNAPKPKQEKISEIFKKLVWGFRILRLRKEVREPLLASVGLTDPDLFAYIRGWEDELVERSQIPADVATAPITWRAKKQEP